MHEDRRGSRFPSSGRRAEDAAMRELVREMLDDEGYMTRDKGDLRWVRKNEVHQGLVDRRAAAALWIALVGLFAGPFLGALASHWIGS